MITHFALIASADSHKHLYARMHLCNVKIMASAKLAYLVAQLQEQTQ